MKFIILAYSADADRRPLPIQRFNADNLMQAQLKATAARGIRFVFKVEVAVIIQEQHKVQGEWFPPG